VCAGEVDVQLEQFVTEGLGDASYLLASDGEALVVDPQRDADRFLAAAERLGVSIAQVVETHVHNDYLTGALELRAATGAEVTGPAEGGYAFAHRALREGDELAVGTLRIRAIETPGHTPEHLSYLVFDGDDESPVAVFTGGSLIVGNAGRTDLLGPDRAHELVRAQYRSLRRLAALPEEVLVLPTHGSGSFCASGPATSERTSTIGRELAGNPALTAPDEATFEREQLEGLPSYPVYYRNMASINRTGPAVLGRIPVPPALAPERFAELADGARIVDGRRREDFAADHIPGAVNVELDDQFASYVGWVLPFDSPIVLVAPGDRENEREASGAEAARALARIGFERVLGFLGGGMEAWRGAGRPVTGYDAVELQRLCDELGSRGVDPSRVLDVRQAGEWNAGHVAGSRHAFVGDLAEAADVPGLGLAPTDPHEPWWVICASGHRASVAASLLAREGVPVRLVARGGVVRLLRTCDGIATESAPH
jgi:glyoxylase-like metal-dependent hydrolase (beta-lactamase superfamily II)/rhodanese-related sulfurtransferase